MESTKKPCLVHPPKALISSNPLKWFRFFGPGAIIASVTIGSGELLFPSRGGAIFGYNILWVFLFVGFLKWAAAYSSMRHMVLSGAHPLERWTEFPGPRGWIHLLIMIVAVLALPLNYAFLGGVLGTVCVWVFGIGNYYTWTTICIGLAIILLLMGGYDFLEKMQAGILGVMLVCILIAVFYLNPNWLGVAKGLVPQPVFYPDWLFDTLPEMSRRSVWVEVLVYVAVIGGSGTDYLAYTSFLRDKEWGRSHMGPASEEELLQIAHSSTHSVRLWLRATLVDTTVSMIIVVLIASAFSILGTVVLKPQELVPEGVNLLNHQAAFLTSLTPWLLPLYQLAVLVAFFGTIYGGPELAARNFDEIRRIMPRFRNSISKNNLRIVIVGWCLVGGLIMLWLTQLYPGVGLIDIFTPVAIFTGFLLAIILTVGNPWMDYRFLPKALRIPMPLVITNLLAALLFTIAGVKALWDYGQVSACVGLGAAILLSTFLAYRFPSIFGPR